MSKEGRKGGVGAALPEKRKGREYMTAPKGLSKGSSRSEKEFLGAQPRKGGQVERC